MKKQILFLTGTRADYGKLKSLMNKVKGDDEFDLHIFVTGMHMLSRYGSTYRELEKDGFTSLYKYINQGEGTPMDIALSSTISGLSYYVNEIKPDLIVIHGDRLEALAGAIVGAFNNIKVAHIEGGEVSGTIDESIRHAITKFSHFHLVANENAKKRVLQLGESEKSIHIIGSPDIDIMHSDSLPTLEQAKLKYDINFDNYGILMYHPVTTRTESLVSDIKSVVDAVLLSNFNYIVVYPNNDKGSDIILKEYKRLEFNNSYKIFPSIKFEYFLTLLKNSSFIIGNSSAGIREANEYGIPAINVGVRQNGRDKDTKLYNIFHVNEDTSQITEAITKALQSSYKPQPQFGLGSSSDLFLSLLKSKSFWKHDIQKFFVDIK